MSTNVNSADALATANMAHAAAVRAAYREHDRATANAADLSRPLRCDAARKTLNGALDAASVARDAALAKYRAAEAVYRGIADSECVEWSDRSDRA
jgi:hypothetical protein